MERRKFLEMSAALWTSAWGASCLGTPEDGSLEPVQDLAQKLFESMDDALKAKGVVDYDHPLRQYHNRGVNLGGVDVDHQNFSWSQLKLLNRLFYSGLSAEGREILPRQQFISWTGVRTLRVLIAGDPNTPHYQVIFSGPHMNFRLGGKNREGVAFGGPLVYGDQHGNFRQGLPGNVYQYQFRKGWELYASLTAAQKEKALLARAPVQTQIELRGHEGPFPGLPVAELKGTAKNRTRELVHDLLRVYHDEDVAYAWSCLEENGGLDPLHLSYYQEGEVDQSGEYQIFRLEGPAAVFYFRGYPHVHAFINVAMDGNRPLSVGETLGENETERAGPAVKSLFERVMKARAGADFGYYDLESAVGRLRTGVIRTGDIYNLESWGNQLRVVSILAADVTGSAKSELLEQGFDPQSDATITIATTDYLADEVLRETFGRGRTSSIGVLLRDATIDYLKTHGFRA